MTLRRPQVSERKLKPSLFDPGATTGRHENRCKRLEVVLGFNSHPARRLPARRNTTIPRFGYILRWQSSSHGAPASSNVLLGPSRCRAGCDSLVPLRSMYFTYRASKRLCTRPLEVTKRMRRRRQHQGPPAAPSSPNVVRSLPPSSVARSRISGSGCQPHHAGWQLQSNSF